MTESTEPTLTVNGKDYKISELNEETTAELTSMRMAEQEMARLQSSLAIVTTARNAYRQALVNKLPQATQ